MKTKVDIISGFLGAGKTTLIKKLITEKLSDERLVVIENEFGETGIDGSVIKNSNIEVREINAGCICCSMSGEFIAGISEVIRKYHPDRIMIEPTGVGKLNDVLRACEDRKISGLVTLNMVICVVDVLKFKAYITNFSEFYKNQIKYAKTVILSKTAKADSARLDDVTGEIRKINGSASIVTTDWKLLSGEQIVSLAEAASDYSLGSQLKKTVVIKRPGGHRYDHSADEAFEVWETETPRKYSREQIGNILKELQDWDKYGMVLRSKGILEQPDGNWFNYDYVPGEAEMRDYKADYSGRICVIGSRLKRKELGRLFHI